MEARLAVELASRAAFEVILRPLANISGTESKHLALTLRSLLAPSLLLSQNPRTLIQLVVQSLTPTPARSFHSSLVASLINASTLALLNAGAVPMRGVVCAVAVGRSRSPGLFATPHSILLILDPDESESASLEGGGCFAFHFTVDTTQSGGTGGDFPELVWSNWQPTTPFNENEIVRARDLARAGSKLVWGTMKESVGRMGEPAD
jgi:exosome complex component RRP46